MDVAARAGVIGTVVSLQDVRDAAWLTKWPEGYCAQGSRLRFTLGAIGRAHHARNGIVFVTHAGLSAVGRLVKQITGSRMYTFLHGVEVCRYLPLRTRWGLRGCDMFIANSQHTLDRFQDLHQEFSTVDAKVCYLPARPINGRNGVGTAARSSSPRVVVVGRLHNRGMKKGQRELIQVWPQIRQQFPDAELWIVGGGEGQRALADLAAAHGVSDCVELPGRVRDETLERIYSNATVYAMPSESEGFGLVFAEAMQRGLPCIASRSDAGSEVVSDGETGLVIDRNSPEQLVEALTRLLSDSALCRRMGEAGRKRVQERFSYGGFVERMTSILTP